MQDRNVNMNSPYNNNNDGEQNSYQHHPMQNQPQYMNYAGNEEYNQFGGGPMQQNMDGGHMNSNFRVDIAKRNGYDREKIGGGLENTQTEFAGRII